MRLLSTIAASLTLAACGGAPPRSAPAPVADAPRFVPRLVRQAPTTLYAYSRVEVAGVGRREVSVVGHVVRVLDPDTGITWTSERFEPLAIELDPSLWRACVIAGAGRIGAYDLRTQQMLWTREQRHMDRVIATRELCVAQTPHGMRAFDLETGAPRTIDAPPFDLSIQGDRFVLWSRDLTRRYDRALATSPTGPAWLDQLRDGTTLAARATLWTSCVDASGPIDRIGLHETEDATRRAQLARVVDAEWIECEPPTWRDGSRHLEGGLPAPWLALDEGRLVHHGEHGLFLFDWAARRSPVRLTPMPVPRYRDVDHRERPLEPVLGDGWIGVIDPQAGALLRFDHAGAPLPPIVLPSGPDSDEPPGWQVFAAPGDRLLVIRESNRRRTAFVSSGHGWTRSGARALARIWQHAEWRGDHWLLSDSHRGIQLVEPERGAVLATFAVGNTYGRISRAMPSPDGTRLAVIVGPWPADDTEGVYILDARTLAVLARHPSDRSLASTHDALAWDARGIVVATLGRGLFVGPRWVLIDPDTGARQELGTGTQRTTWGHSRNGAIHVARTDEGDALVARDGDHEVAIVSIGADGSGGVQLPDGRVWCEAACPQYRCIVDVDRAEPFDHPACAPMRVASSSAP